MRTIRLIGSAAAAAIAVMAVAGVSSAMAEATLLCKNNTVSETPSLAECGEVKEVHLVTVKINSENRYVLGKAKMLSGTFGTIECHVLVNAVRASGALTAGAATFHVTLHYSECSLGCSVYDGTLELGTDPLFTLLILRTGSELATVVGDGFSITLVCGSALTCDYGGETLIGHGAAPGPILDALGKVHVTYTLDPLHLFQKLSTGIFNCPTSLPLDTLLQTLGQLYIRK